MDLICLEPPADYTDYADHADWEMGERATRTTRTARKPRTRDLWFWILAKKFVRPIEICLEKYRTEIFPFREISSFRVIGG